MLQLINGQYPLTNMPSGSTELKFIKYFGENFVFVHQES